MDERMMRFESFEQSEARQGREREVGEGPRKNEKTNEETSRPPRGWSLVLIARRVTKRVVFCGYNRIMPDGSLHMIDYSSSCITQSYVDYCYHDDDDDININGGT